MNKLAPYLLVACLAFFGGRISVEGFSFDFGSIVAPKIEGPLWLVTVDESEQRDVGLGALQRNTDYLATLKSRDVTMRNYDDDQPEAIEKGYSAIAAQLGKPAVIVFKKSGEKVLVKPLPIPVSPSGIDAILAEVGR